MTSMQAYQLTGPNAAELRRVAIPEPGPGEVLVKVAGGGLCHSDLHLLHAPELPWDLPMTLGHETAGWVDSLGDGASGLEIGEPVVVHGPWGCGRCRFCRADHEQLCERALTGGHWPSGLGADGGLAEYICVPAVRSVVPLGDLDPVDAGPLDDAALTPYHVIKRWRHLLVPGSAVVLIGVGGLGHVAIQLLRALSAATVVAVDIDDAKLDLAISLGADAALRNGADIVDGARDAMHGRGAVLVLDFVTSDETLALAAQLADPMAHVCAVGAGPGTFPYSFLALPNETTISNTYWGTSGELREVVALARAGHIRVHTVRRPLSETASVYAELEAGRIEGRAVVVP